MEARRGGGGVKRWGWKGGGVEGGGVEEGGGGGWGICGRFAPDSMTPR